MVGPNWDGPVMPAVVLVAESIGIRDAFSLLDWTPMLGGVCVSADRLYAAGGDRLRDAVRDSYLAYEDRP